MARYRKIDPRIWSDAKFRSMSFEGQFVFIYLLTHPHLTMVGAMRHSIPGLAAELGWPLKRFAKGFREGLSKGILNHDERASLVIITNFIKYNQPENPNVVKAWVSVIELLPECNQKVLLIQRLMSYLKGLGKGYDKPFEDCMPNGMPNGMPNQEQEQEQEQEQDITPPTPSVEGGRVSKESLFQKFWEAYPGRRKTCKQEAIGLWLKLDFSNGLFETIMSALDWQKKSHDWTKENGQYIPNPAKWIRGRRWLDEPDKTNDPHSWIAKVEK